MSKIILPLHSNILTGTGRYKEVGQCKIGDLIVTKEGLRPVQSIGVLTKPFLGTRYKSKHWFKDSYSLDGQLFALRKDTWTDVRQSTYVTPFAHPIRFNKWYSSTCPVFPSTYDAGYVTGVYLVAGNFEMVVLSDAQEKLQFMTKFTNSFKTELKHGFKDTLTLPTSEYLEYVKREVDWLLVGSKDFARGVVDGISFTMQKNVHAQFDRHTFDVYILAQYMIQSPDYVNQIEYVGFQNENVHAAWIQVGFTKTTECVMDNGWTCGLEMV